MPLCLLLLCFPSFTIHHALQSSVAADSFEESRFPTLYLFSPFSLKVTPFFGAHSTTHYPPVGAKLSQIFCEIFFFLLPPPFVDNTITRFFFHGAGAVTEHESFMQ